MSLILIGKLLHSDGPNTLKAVLAKVFNLVLRTVSLFTSMDECRFLAGGDTLTIKSFRYLGAIPFRHQ